MALESRRFGISSRSSFINRHSPFGSFNAEVSVTVSVQVRLAPDKFCLQESPMNKLSVMKLGLVLIASIGLFACGGGGGGSAPETTGSRNIGGGGVKGPLANAIVTVYRFDASQTGFKGAVAATATTDAAAAISGLSLPFPVSPPYIIEFTSDAGTTDVTTGMVPVIGSMRSVITQSLLDTGEQVYATPLTTMAVDIAIANSTPTTSQCGRSPDRGGF